MGVTGTTKSWSEFEKSRESEGLGMNASTMRQLADALQKLSEVGVAVTSFSFANYVMHVTRHEDQREGAWYTLERIERA